MFNIEEERVSLDWGSEKTIAKNLLRVIAVRQYLPYIKGHQKNQVQCSGSCRSGKKSYSTKKMIFPVFALRFLLLSAGIKHSSSQIATLENELFSQLLESGLGAIDKDVVAVVPEKTSNLTFF